MLSERQAADGDGVAQLLRFGRLEGAEGEHQLSGLARTGHELAPLVGSLLVWLARQLVERLNGNLREVLAVFHPYLAALLLREGC